MFVDRNIFSDIFGVGHGLFFFFILTLEDDPKQMMRSLRIGVFFYFINYTLKLFITNALDSFGSNHDFGYKFMFVSIVYLVWFIKEKKPLSLIVFAISTVEMILVGARTTIAAFLFFVVLYYFFNNLSKERIVRKILTSIIIGLFSLLVLSDFFRNYLSSILSELNINSKIINSFLTGNNELDGGRIMMYETDSLLVKEHFFGLGVYWDRYMFNGRFTYTHNFFYELILDFGWVVGLLILAAILIYTVRILFDKENDWKILYIIFISLWVVRLIFSYSFWIEPTFWASIAIIVNFHYCKKRNLVKTSCSIVRRTVLH